MAATPSSPGRARLAVLAHQLQPLRPRDPSDATPTRCGASADDAAALPAEVDEWLAQVSRNNYDGVTLTPALAEYLSGDPAEVGAKLRHLDELRAATLQGRFDPDQRLQRDLEFHHFVWAYNEHVIQGSGEYPAPVEPGPGNSDALAAFERLEVLPPPAPRPAPFVLSDDHRLQSHRAAREALEFLRFLRAFRERTTRPILIAANDRYGRQWVAEPLAAHLAAMPDVTWVTPRVPSHKSTRLTVPRMIERTGARAGFGRDVVERLAAEMPHVIIVDARSPPDDRAEHERGRMRFSRGARDLANWFLAYNRVRQKGAEEPWAADAPPEWLSRTP